MKKYFLLFSLGVFALSKDFNAEVINYTKIGFNNNAINLQDGTYPTDSFSVLYTSINYNKNLEHLFFGAGLAFGGIVFDSTKSDIKDGLAYKYLGYNTGFLGDQKASAQNTQNYFIKDLYIGYQNSHFKFSVGRFLFNNTDWLTGRHAGAEIHFFTHSYDFYAAISEKKSSYGGKWLKTYKFMNSSKIPTFVLGTKMNFDALKLDFYLQSHINLYYAFGIHTTYQTNFNTSNQDISSKSDFIGLYVYHTNQAQEKFSGYDMGSLPIYGAIDTKNPTLQGYLGRKVGHGGFSLGFKQTFGISSYNFGIQLYGNIGNPNEFIGRYGNPIGIDLNDNTIYDRGTANNAIFDYNSFSNIIFMDKKFPSCTIKVSNRFTTSKRNNEENFSVSASYKIEKNTTIGINLSLYLIETNAGYKIYKTYLTHSRWDDRSFASTYITHRF